MDQTIQSQSSSMQSQHNASQLLKQQHSQIYDRSYKLNYKHVGLDIHPQLKPQSLTFQKHQTKRYDQSQTTHLLDNQKLMSNKNTSQYDLGRQRTHFLNHDNIDNKSSKFSIQQHITHKMLRVNADIGQAQPRSFNHDQYGRLWADKNSKYSESFGQSPHFAIDQRQRKNASTLILKVITLNADFCDDDALSKISRVNKDIRKMIVEESKDRYIRILEYKYLKVCMVLESLMDKLQQGQIIDLEMIEDAKDGLKLGLSNKNFDHQYQIRHFTDIFIKYTIICQFTENFY